MSERSTSEEDESSSLGAECAFAEAAARWFRSSVHQLSDSVLARLREARMLALSAGEAALTGRRQ